MSTALEADTSLDLDLSLDFEPEYPCEATSRHRSETAPPKASWWSFALCCGRSPVTLCSPCVTHEMALGWICSICGAMDTPEQPNRRYEPIRSQK